MVAVLLGMALAALIRETFRALVSRAPEQTRTSGRAWLALAMREVGRAYGRSQDLAVSSYRLERALRTGRTMNAPGSSQRQELLSDLRNDFQTAVNAIAPNVLAEMAYPATPETGEVVDVDVFEDLAEVLQRLESETETFARQSLLSIGPEAYTALAQDLEDIDDEFDELFDRQADAVAAEAARIARRGGRTGRRTLYQRDELATGYARVCAQPGLTGDHPCHFCSMLMSRGLVYRTKEAALGTNPDGYHINCDCEAIEVWSQADYDTDERFDLNREMQQLWNDNIQNKYSGRAARNAWRRLLYHRRRGAQVAPNQAQEATPSERIERADDPGAAVPA